MGLVACVECGKEVSSSAPRCPNCGYSVGQYSGKSKGLAIVLALFLGGLGIHKFYLGKPGVGFIYLIFCWTFIPAILGLIDALVLAGKNEREFTGAVRPGIASNLAMDNKGEIKPIYQQPAFWAVLSGVILIFLAVNLAN
jgi:TM2 domain-containing membrane protein YozV